MSLRLELATFRLLVREEWRLHTELFGGWRFVLFPAFVAALAVGGGFALAETGTSSGAIVAGLHVFALVFGLYSGTAGFAGSDMLENVFGRLTLLLSSGTTLPLSRRRLLGLFLAKDALFYGVVFVVPMALAVVSLPEYAGRPLRIGALWVSLSGTFVVGMVTTVTLIAVRTRRVPTLALIGTLGVSAVLAWWTGVHRLLWEGIVIHDGTAGGSVTHAAALAGLTLVVALGSLALYDPAYARPTRTASDRFAQLERSLPVADDGLVAKTLLDLVRSSGGVWKPLVSAGILLALTAFLVRVVADITGIAPAPGIFFGGVLGLSAFTTYNWLTQFDSVEEYLAYPVSVEAVFRTKRTAFVLVGAPTVAIPYLGAILWFGATPLDAAVGALLLAGYSLYYYGLTVYIAGFDPNEFLFDVVRFSTFTLGVGVVLVPTLVVGFVVVPPTPSIVAALATSGIVFATVGVAFSSRAGPRWGARYRAG